MRRIIPLELVGLESYNYDLFDESGNMIYKKGEKFSPGMLMMLNFKKVYRKEDVELSATGSEQEIESIIPDEVTDYLIQNTKKIMLDTLDGKKTDVDACIETGKIIVEEVGNKIDKIECIGQLRVYDEYTFSHTINVSTLSSALAMALGFSDQEVKDITLAALLHDIGKMKIPKEILNKPGKLEPNEFQIIKKHTTLGYKHIIEEMKLPEHLAKVALEHQERYGGKGYPCGLKGEEISKFAQVAAIADVYDALVSERVYKKAILSHEALKIMLSEGSTSFNPYMLYKFVYLANFRDTVTLGIKSEKDI